MSDCEKLQEMLARAMLAENGPLIEALQAALVAAGCTVQTDSGGTGRPGGNN